jgi:hypothetical protein
VPEQNVPICAELLKIAARSLGAGRKNAKRCELLPAAIERAAGARRSHTPNDAVRVG